jgi:FtsP/CotA-like multicopper oxidase with cupredoxin domain
MLRFFLIEEVINMDLNRREFLTFIGLGSSAFLLNSCGIDSVDLSSDGGSSSDNSTPQQLFKNPELASLNRNGSVVEVDLNIEKKSIDIDGNSVNMLTYNGYYPAPTIKVKSGDTLKINFSNNIPSNIGTNILGADMSVTNLHTHGFHVSPTGNSDNVTLEIKSGETFNYEYDLSKQWGGFMAFYHPHKHKTVAEQMWRGISGGALIVEDDVDTLKDFDEKIMILSDVTVQGNEPTHWTRMDYMRNLGSTVMVNGMVNPVLEIRPGQVQRWRIVNTSVYRIYRLSLENHKLYLVGTDSNLLNKPVELSEIILSPGERIDVLIKANQAAGSYKFYSKSINDADTVTLLTVDYAGSPSNDSIPDSIPSTVSNEVQNLRQMDISSLRNVEMTLSFVGGMGGGGMKGAINGKVFGEDTYILESPVGTYEIWTIYNQTGMPHPFHQHVDSSVILEVSGSNSIYYDYQQLYSSLNAFKDTIIVPPHGYVKMLVPVQDFYGDTVFHCHMLGHEDIGMMGIWRRT